MLNYIWLGLVIAAVLIGGWHSIIGAETGTLKEMTEQSFEMAKTAVTIAIGLIGIMALWLGVMRLAEKSGLIQIMARAMRPIMRWLFPDVPVEHPAMGSMLMNMAANFLGLANAATPLGLRAMRDLETLNPRPGVASNAMVTFLAVNTSSIQLLPITAVGILAVAGSAAPYAIIGTAIMATTCSTIAGVTMVKLLEKLPWYRLPPLPDNAAENQELRSRRREEADNSSDKAQMSPPPHVGGYGEAMSVFGRVILSAYLLFFVVLLLGISFPELFRQPASEELAAQNPFVRVLNTISLLAIPFMLSFFPLFALLKRVKVYEQFVEGAKEGFQVAVTIIPFLVAILVAIGMFRGAGGIKLLTDALEPVMNFLHFPSELLPMCLMRPLSGSGTLGIFTELVQTHGPDALISRMAGTIFGSTETTFYVIAVYFGSVNVRNTRHAIPAGLFADFVGIVASVIICRVMFA